MFEWPATIQLVVVAAVVAGGALAWIAYASRKLERERDHRAR